MMVIEDNGMLIPSIQGLAVDCQAGVLSQPRILPWACAYLACGTFVVHSIGLMIPADFARETPTS